MGATKRLLERIESRRADFVGANYVCGWCVKDETLQAYVRQNADGTRCDYCEREGGSVLVDDLMDIIMEGVFREYDDPLNELGWDSEDGRWVGDTIDKWDLIADLDITENSALYEDIVSAITLDEWCEQDAYVLPKHERLAYGWRTFSEMVKHENRYYYSRRKRGQDEYHDPDEMSPEELLIALEDTIEELALVVVLPAGTAIVRARQHDGEEAYTTVEQLGPPPKDKASANRMSSQGIPMFYGAFDDATALAEVHYPGNRRAATVATFVTARDVNIVDLSSLPGVPSIFDADHAHLRSITRFIRDFMADFSKPILETDAAIEYVPTQIVTEHIRHAMSGNIKGVIYPSSKFPDGKSCVLFVTNEECREPGEESYPTNERYLEFVPASVRQFPPVSLDVGVTPSDKT